MVLPDQDSGLPVAPEEIIAPEDIYEPEDDEDSTCPPMASGYNCYKNWDSALLQNCTNDRLKIIANDYESVGSARHKKELYKMIFAAMTADTDCVTCPGGDCDPYTHMFRPTVHPPQGWVMGPSGIYVKPPTATVTSAQATTSQQQPGAQPPGSITTQAGLVTTQTTSQNGSPAISPQQRIDIEGFMNHADRLTLSNGLGLGTGPSPSATLHRPTYSPDQPVGQPGTPLIPGVNQQHAPPNNVPQLMLNGANAFQAMDAATAGGSLHTNPLAAYQAQLDAEDAERRKKNELEILELQKAIEAQTQQNNQQAQLSLLQQYTSQREQENLAHQQLLQQMRAAATSAAPVRMPTPNPQPVPTRPPAAQNFGESN